MAIEVGCPLYEVLCRLALAEILADCGDERKCVAHLQTLRGIARGIDNHHLEFACLVGFAQIALGHGRSRTGLAALRRGLELGREYGYAHFLWWRPAAVARGLGARAGRRHRARVREQPDQAPRLWCRSSRRSASRPGRGPTACRLSAASGCCGTTSRSGEAAARRSASRSICSSC